MLKKSLLYMTLTLMPYSLFAHGFVAGTQIKTFHNDESIEEIKKGNTVISCDLIQCRFQKVLTDVTESVEMDTIEIVTESGQILESSSTQQIYVRNKGWVLGNKIRVGDYVFNSELKPVRIEFVSRRENNETTYSFKVSGDHNYFANDILVHNSEGGNGNDNGNGGNGGPGGGCEGPSCRAGDGGRGGDGGHGNGNGNGNGSK